MLCFFERIFSKGISLFLKYVTASKDANRNKKKSNSALEIKSDKDIKENKSIKNACLIKGTYLLLVIVVFVINFC